MIFEHATSTEESEALKDTVKLINETFSIPADLKLIFGGDDGPLFDGETNEIFIPYFFANEIKQRFEADN